MNKVMLHSARENKSKLKDLAILSGQSIQERLLDQETKDLKKARLHLYVTEEYLTQMLLDDTYAIRGRAHLWVCVYSDIRCTRQHLQAAAITSNTTWGDRIG